jgi:CRISPR/Cas system CSM-associated protein Csm4 (group 5 of RAMP superfamily)
MKEEICEGCEWNNGKECTNSATGSFEPYNNACQRVLDIAKELNSLKKCQVVTDKSWRELVNELQEVKNKLREMEVHKNILAKALEDTPQQEVLDAIRDCWKCHSHLTFTELLRHALVTDDHSWKVLSNKEVEKKLVDYAIFD